MAVKDWINAAPDVEAHEPFDGALKGSGSLIGSPRYVDGVDGKALECGANQGAALPMTAEAARGYPSSLSIWFRFPSGGATADIVRWGNAPGMGAWVYGANSPYPAGTVEAWVRMSSGEYALRARSAAVQADEWHLLTITVQQTTIWGGARATFYMDGKKVAASQLSGSILNIVNFNRPDTLTVGVSDGTVMVDELVVQERETTGEEVAALYASAESLTRGVNRAGWGIIFG